MIKRRRRPPDVGVTLWTPSIGLDHQRLLDEATLFDSVEQAIASHAQLPRSADGARLFARVRAPGPIQIPRVQQALEGLPSGSELVVAVESTLGH